MTRKTNSHKNGRTDKLVGERSGNGVHPSEADELLRKVERLLQEGRHEKALESISHSRLLQSPRVQNALGVCLLRLGEAERATEVLRRLVLASGSITLRQDVPGAFKANFATALLASKNVSGCLGVLNEMNDEANPAVQQIRTALRRWKDGLSRWQRFQWFMGSTPGPPVVLDFPLGSLG